MYPVLTSIFTAWELCEIVRNSPEHYFHSLHFYSFCMLFQHICLFLTVIDSDFWWFILLNIMFSQQCRTFLSRKAVRGPNNDHFWSLHHLNLTPGDETNHSPIKKLSIPGECAHAAVQLQLLFMHWCPYLNFRELLCRWIFWWRFLLMRWMKDQNNRGVCACEEEEKWMKCAGMCACQARIK